MRAIIDSETNGLLEDTMKDGVLQKAATIIYCLCYYDIDTKKGVYLTKYEDMIEFLTQENLTIIGHNIKRFDIPMFEKMLGIKFKGRAIDTLPLSWYIFPTRENHNLEGWGIDLGVEKPEITDWQHGDIMTYVHRCIEDVKINTLLFDLQIAQLNAIYGELGITRIINYLMFKMDCAREQEEVKWKLDVKKCQENLAFILKEMDAKVDLLKVIMPKVTIYKKVERPKVFTKKDGTISSLGQKWIETLTSLGLPEYHVGTVLVPIKEEEGNPGSPAQLKKWLFSLGWKPLTFDYKRKNKHDYESELRSIPQINTKNDGICESVKLLYEKEPQLVQLENLYLLRHRKGILEGFLEDRNENDYLQAQVQGFTNTLRFKHTQIVNPPTVFKPYGKEVRGVLTVPDESYILCGSDVSGLEDQCKRHYMYPYDPEYVKEMMRPDFDPHLDIAAQGKLITPDEDKFYRWYDAEKERLKEDFKPTPEHKAEFTRISKKRKDAKQVNFSATYGAGPAKMHLSSGMPIELCVLLHGTYWKRNWAIKKIAAKAYVKTVNGQMWIYNPVSGFYYSLRYDKDRFSTLNQSTGVYCFDTWVRKVRAKGIRLCGQFHDEIAFPLKKELREQRTKDLRDAMREANEELKLNVQLNISIDFGLNYADVH